MRIFSILFFCSLSIHSLSQSDSLDWLEEGFRNEVSFNSGGTTVLGGALPLPRYSLAPNFQIGFRHVFGRSFFQSGLSYIPMRYSSIFTDQFSNPRGIEYYTVRSIGLPISYGLQTSILRRIVLRAFLGVMPTYTFRISTDTDNEKANLFQFSNVLIGCESSLRATKAINLNFSIEYLRGFSYGFGKIIHFKHATSIKLGFSRVF